MFPFVWWRKPSVAGHEVIGNHGNQPLPWGVDDAAAAFLVRGMENKRKMKPEAGYDIQEKE